MFPAGMFQIGSYLSITWARSAHVGQYNCTVEDEERSHSAMDTLTIHGKDIGQISVCNFHKPFNNGHLQLSFK